MRAYSSDKMLSRDLAADVLDALNSHASLSAEKEALQQSLNVAAGQRDYAINSNAANFDRAEKLSAENAILREQRDAVQRDADGQTTREERLAREADALAVGLQYHTSGLWGAETIAPLREIASALRGLARYQRDKAALSLYRKGP
jgi:hypothetical protein